MLGRKRLKERALKSNYFRSKQMAKVTYRGVEYDTNEYNKKVLNEAAQQRNHDLMYRGIRHEHKFASKS